MGNLPGLHISCLGDSLGKKQVQLAFDPNITDLGDIAKSLGKLGGPMEKPVALVWMSQMSSDDEPEKRLKEELTNVKGIVLKQCAGTRIALDEAGGAKYGEIRAAFKKADVPVLYD